MNGERPFPQFPGIAGRREISAQAGDIRHQFPHVFLSGGPAHAEAHRAVGFILPAQIAKPYFLPSSSRTESGIVTNCWFVPLEKGSDSPLERQKSRSITARRSAWAPSRK